MPSVQLFEIVEGWTEPLKAQLILNGAFFDGTGMTVTATVRDKNGALVTIACAWDTITLSKVKLTPLATDFAAALGPYAVHYKVVDGSNTVAFFPMGDPAMIVVHPL